MFRGNPSRTFYGTGPVVASSSESSLALSRSADVFRILCWEKRLQAMVRQWMDGATGRLSARGRHNGSDFRRLRSAGALRQRFHMVSPPRNPFPTGDIIKGSVTIDPDGFPTSYTLVRATTNIEFLRLIAATPWKCIVLMRTKCVAAFGTTIGIATGRSWTIASLSVARTRGSTS
jgi:hypothetical protein